MFVLLRTSDVEIMITNIDHAKELYVVREPLQFPALLYDGMM